MRLVFGLLPLLPLLALLLALPAAAEEESFSFDAYERKAYAFGGSFEAKAEHFRFDRAAAGYALGFLGEDEESSGRRATGTLALDGRYDLGPVSLFGRVESELDHDWTGTAETTVLQEAYASTAPAKGLTLQAGKRTLRWGKGYAWSPVGFVERAKDPTDPEEAREGFVMALADGVTTFSGPLRNLGLTAVALPTRNDLNDEFGTDTGLNGAVKLSALLWDTDLDLVAFAGAARSRRIGADLSRNLATNFEIHGEVAWVEDAPQRLAAAGGVPLREEDDAWQVLAGLRYLTEFDLTVIAEYFRNGAGYHGDELADFYRRVQRARAAGDTGALRRLAGLNRGAFGRFTPGRDYAYLRLSQKEPFDWLYVTPAATLLVNLNDGSFQVAPEIAYTGIDNLTLKLKFGVAVGDRLEEYGEKQTDWRVEATAKYAF